VRANPPVGCSILRRRDHYRQADLGLGAFVDDFRKIHRRLTASSSAYKLIYKRRRGLFNAFCALSQAICDGKD